MYAQGQRMDLDAPAAPLVPPCTPITIRKTNLFATPQPPARLELNTQLKYSHADHYSRFNKQMPSSPAFPPTGTLSPPSSSSSDFSSSPYKQPNSSPPSSPPSSSPPFLAKEAFQKPPTPSLLSPPITPVATQHFSTPKPGSNPTVSYQHLQNHNLEPMFTSRYVIQDELGSGGFGFVVSAVRIADGREVAVKFILRAKVPRHGWVSDPELGLVPIEIAILSSVDHDSIVRMEDYYQDEKFFYLIMELHGNPWTKSTSKDGPKKALSTSGGWSLNPFNKQTASREKKTLTPNNNVTNLPKRTPLQRCTTAPLMVRRPSHDLFECIETQAKFTEPQARHIFRQIVDAVHYLDTHLDVVHRDIKDENIIISSDLNVKLIDFGSAVILPPKVSGEREAIYFDRFYGTMNFASPQILKGLSYRAEPAEMWSLGVLLFTILTGEVPFSDPYTAAAGREWPSWKVEGKVSRECVEVLDGLLTREIEPRWRLEALIKARWWTVRLS
jgi:serine/threonine protein kinase